MSIQREDAARRQLMLRPRRRCSNSQTERGVEMVDLKFVDLPGAWQHMTLPLGRARRGGLRDRARVRRLLDPRLPGDPRVGHAPDPGCDDRVHRPVLHAHDAVADLLDRRSGARRAVWPRSALRGPESREPPRVGAGSLTSPTSGPRPSSSSSTTSPTSSASTAPSTRSTPTRASGTRARSGRRAEPRVQAPPEGGLLPGPAGRLARQPSRRDGDDDGVARDQVRVPPPRGLLGRPGRDRHALPAAAADGRPDDDLQVRGQEHRRGGGQDRDVHAEADLPGERVRDARAPVAVEGRRSTDVRPGRYAQPQELALNYIGGLLDHASR